MEITLEMVGFALWLVGLLLLGIFVLLNKKYVDPTGILYSLFLIVVGMLIGMFSF